MEIALNKGYKARDFEEMYKPVLYLDQAHSKISDEISRLDMEAGEWEKLADSSIDEDSYNQYRGYADKLKQTAKQLSSEGLNGKIIQDALNLRGEYSRNIVPLKQAEQKRNTWLDEQRKLQAQDATMRFSLDPKNISLQQLIKDPSMNYTPLSGAKMKQDVQSTVEHFKNKIINDPGKWSHALGLTYERLISRGYNIEDVAKVVNGHKDADPVLSQIYNEALSTFGIDEYKFNDTDTQYLKNKIAEGLYAAVGRDDLDKLNLPQPPTGGRRTSGSGETKDGIGFNPIVRDYFNIEGSKHSKVLEKLNTDKELLYSMFGKNLDRNPYEYIEELKESKPEKSAFDFKSAFKTLSGTNHYGFRGPDGNEIQKSSDIQDYKQLEELLKDSGVTKEDDAKTAFEKIGSYVEETSIAYSGVGFNLSGGAPTSASLLSSVRVKNGKVPGITKIDSKTMQDTNEALTKKELNKILGDPKEKYSDTKITTGLMYMQHNNMIVFEDDDGNLYRVNPREFPTGVDAVLKQTQQQLDNIKGNKLLNHTQRNRRLREAQSLTSRSLGDIIAKYYTPVGGSTSNKPFQVGSQEAMAYGLIQDYENGSEEYRNNPHNIEEVRRAVEFLQSQQ